MTEEAKVRYVDATFAGKKIRFELKEEFVHVLEQTLGVSLYQAFAKFSAKLWNFRELQIILSFAAVDALWTAEEKRHLKYVAKIADRGHTDLVVPAVQAIKSALAARPPAPYSVLAFLVLEAYLFGIPEEFAVFVEGDMSPDRMEAAQNGEAGA